MLKAQAIAIATEYHIPMGQDFHALPSDVVCRIIDAADKQKYRKPRKANGSRARYFYAMLTRAHNAKVPEYNVQGHYGHGWEDLTASLNYREARADLKAYRENAPGCYRLITRRVPV